MSRERRAPLATGVDLIQDMSAVSSPIEGFLRRLRHRIKIVLSDGSRTELTVADAVDRPVGLTNGVAVAVYARPKDSAVEDTLVLLRRQLRYGAYLANGSPLTAEVIAGLIEGDEAIEQTAVREVMEEAGIQIQASQVTPLGRPVFALPSILTEQIYPVAVEVRPAVIEAADARGAPGDGSAFEEGADLFVTTLAGAFALMEVEPKDPMERYLADAKTELSLARLWRWLEDPSR